ncbi:MAG TPA: hypothetical protein VFM55_08215 [Micromonosporaceae bacterium]|nr:hypothetical protein [Micromonosporaceae bacterium]
MGELGAIRTYLYWSERRVRKLAEDNDIRLDPRPPVEVRTPSYGLLPQVGGAVGGQRLSRHQIAVRVERAIGRLAVQDFVTPPPARFAKGVGTVTFAEFVGHGAGTGPAVACTTSTASDGTRVAVCLFGSLGNFAGMVTDAASPLDGPKGWISSDAPSVYRFISDRCQGAEGEGRPGSWKTPEWYAEEALKIAFYQGERSGHDEVVRHPWRRGFTYGHVGEVGEWLAEIFLDLVLTKDLRSQRSSDFDRIVVGAPLWIRTPTPAALHLHDPWTVARLDHRPAPDGRPDRSPWWPLVRRRGEGRAAKSRMPRAGEETRDDDAFAW